MKVLIYGAGQLARMMYLDGVPLGIEVMAVDVNSKQVVHPISKDPMRLTLEQAIEESDALSVEFEHVPEELLYQANESGKLMPCIEGILAGADRVREKALLDRLQIPNCEHVVVTEVDQLDEAVAKLGSQLILKASRDGYDGYGQWRLTDVSQLDALKSELSALDLEKVPLIVERMVAFDREVSLIGVRGVSGEVRFYPLAENLHHKGQLHVSVAPAPEMTDGILNQAKDAFVKLAEDLEYVGVLAVEFFQVGSNLLVNEIAPRVHNSGHWSMQGADTSQFENHLRAVSGLPLGHTEAKGKCAMINVIGCNQFSKDLLSIPFCHLHWYGKDVRDKRKMGHINLTGETYQDLAEVMTTLAKYLPLEHFPCLMDEADKLAKLEG